MNNHELLNEQDTPNVREESFEDYYKKLQSLMDPMNLQTVSMSELFENVYERKPPIIEGLLYPGTYLFVGSPKMGKSFFMVQLAYHVSTGTALWGYPTRKSTVLYLALEDDYKRLQDRLYRMFGVAENENLFFSVSAAHLGNGLDEQLSRFIKSHPDTGLIIVDTLQKIREMSGDNYSYASDYQIINQLKQFADVNGICLILVHHTRKQKADDKFDMISGTNGLLGAADGAFLLRKEKRTSANAVLEVSGRDQQEQKLYLIRDEDSLAWNLERAETELWKEKPEPILKLISEKINESLPEWEGSPTALCELLGTDIKPNVLTLKLNVKADYLLREFGIHYESFRGHKGRRVKLKLQEM